MTTLLHCKHVSGTLLWFGAALALGVGLAQADTTVRMLHVETNPDTVAMWQQAAKDYAAEHRYSKNG